CQEIEDLRTRLYALRHQFQKELGSLASQWAEKDLDFLPQNATQQTNLMSLKQNLVNALRIVMYPCFFILYVSAAKLLTNPHAIPLPHTMLLITICVLLPVVALRFLKRTSQTESEIEVLNLYLKSVSEGMDPIQSFLTLRQKLSFLETTHILNLWHQEMLKRQKSVDSAKMLLKLKALCNQKQPDKNEIQEIANLTLMSTCNVGYLGWDTKLDEPILSGLALATKPELMDQILAMLYRINRSTEPHGPLQQ
ncbi:MAG: hypothetical protein H3C47_01865, partial [Candidatus Cloacimonetes bacterium]|nr:hypothetical protein [Candidatus Cloacimonadota bacterium]